jgi:hypothetical protein
MNVLMPLTDSITTAGAGAKSMWSEVTKGFSETMTGLGVLAAGSYFAWRLYRGYFVQNLSLDLQLKRCAADAELDYLDVTTKVTKGDRNTTRFEDMEVRVWWPGVVSPRIEKVETIRRYNFGYPDEVAKANDQQRFIKVFWDEQHPESPFLNMTPGETTQFSHLLVVPAGLPCYVDVVLIGRVKKSELYGQWRASGISFPISRQDKL